MFLLKNHSVGFGYLAVVIGDAFVVVAFVVIVDDAVVDVSVIVVFTLSIVDNDDVVDNLTCG